MPCPTTGSPRLRPKFPTSVHPIPHCAWKWTEGSIWWMSQGRRFVRQTRACRRRCFIHASHRPACGQTRRHRGRHGVAARRNECHVSQQSQCSWARSDAPGLGLLASFANGWWALPYGGLNHLLRPIRCIRSWNRGSERNGSKAGRIRTHGLKRSSKALFSHVIA
jgi:hypothetical protein